MPQSSRSRHQRTRFPGPHGVATAATASQTATSEWIRQHPVAACDSCPPGYMLHGCFMISPRPWHGQGAFGWEDTFKAPTKESILIVPLLRIRLEGGITIGWPTDHWRFWPHLAVCGCRWWGWSQSEASACLPGVAGVQNMPEKRQ